MSSVEKFKNTPFKGKKSEKSILEIKVVELRLQINYFCKWTICLKFDGVTFNIGSLCSRIFEFVESFSVTESIGWIYSWIKISRFSYSIGIASLKQSFSSPILLKGVCGLIRMPF